jgi:glycosyltransferase involved in cell wall biosynthesis
MTALGKRTEVGIRVLYFGTYDKDYLQNRLKIKGLRAAGVEVVECHVPLWKNTEDKVAAAGGRHGWVSLGWRAFQSYLALLRAYWPLRHSYDVMMLGYVGQFDVFPARVLTWLSRRPLVLDVLMSLYLIASERQLSKKNVLRWIENIACRLPDLLILDTPEYAEWFEQTYGIARTRFHLVPLGADDDIFKPMPVRAPDGKFRVVYYGTYIPLHGVEYIIRAAHLLRDRRDICFQLIGRGPERARAEELAIELALDNVIFSDWVSLEDLPAYAARADVLLGVFGTTQQSNCTIQNKIYQGLAMARPVITGDSPTVRAALTHGQQVYLVERGNATALADAIVALQSDANLRTRLAEQGRRLFEERFTVEAIGQRLVAHLHQVVHERPGPLDG